MSSEVAVARAAKRLKLGEPPAAGMNAKLKTGQRDKVRTFTRVANTDDLTAQQCLSHADWNVERALDIFYQNPSFQDAAQNSSRKIDTFFGQYSNGEVPPRLSHLLDPRDIAQLGAEAAGRIGPNGTLRLLNDLNVDPNSVEALILAWKMHAGTQCEFTQEEFRSGCTEMGVDSLEKLRLKAQHWSAELADTLKFKQLYQFVFGYAKSASMRYLQVDLAIAYWRLIFERKDSRVPVWIEFVQQKGIRGVSQDTWNLFFDFLVTTKEDYSNYDAMGAWPVLIDEFVEFAAAR